MQPVYQFSDYKLDVRDRTLSHHNRELECTGKPLDLLILLLENAGSLVTREQIQKQLWDRRTIEFDPAINTYIGQLRQLLGDNVQSPRLIKTIPKHGYKFIGTIDEVKISAPTRLGIQYRKQVRALAAGLAVTFVALSVFMVAPKPGTTTSLEINQSALTSYIKGQQLYESHEPENRKQAVEWFKRAVESDPNYPLAWSGLADALYYSDPTEIEQARAAVDTALKLDPDLVPALLRRADILFAHDWDFNRAAAIFEKALALDAGDVELRHSYSAFLLATGRRDAAVGELKAALSINPLSAVMTSDLAWTLNLAGHPEDALVNCKILTELAPDNPRTIACPLRPLLALGRVDEAAAVAQRLMRSRGAEITETDPTEILHEFWLWQLKYSVSPFARAIAASHLGQALETMAALEQAHNQRNRMIPFVHLYPEFQALHQLSRFRDIAVGLS